MKPGCHLAKEPLIGVHPRNSNIRLKPACAESFPATPDSPNPIHPLPHSPPLPANSSIAPAQGPSTVAMSFRAASLRSLRLARPTRAPLGSIRAMGPSARSFHATRPAFVQVGDELPDIELAEGSPGNKVSLAREAQKASKAILIGVPAAFSGACSSTHIPGYINHPRLSEFDFVGVVSVNDAFV
jgi:hypothetical protein